MDVWPLGKRSEEKKCGRSETRDSPIVTFILGIGSKNPTLVPWRMPVSYDGRGVDSPAGFNVPPTWPARTYNATRTAQPIPSIV